MPRDEETAGQVLPPRLAQQIDALRREFEASLETGAGVSLAHYLTRVDESGREQLLGELVSVACRRLRRAGRLGPRDLRAELLAANPSLRDELQRMQIGEDGATTVSADDRFGSTGKSSGLVVRCPHCGSTIDLVVDASLVEINCPTCGERFSLVDDTRETRDATALTKVAHFELVERLGIGGFGTVWKARDTMLDRTVALKIPRREQLDAVSIEKFMREARAAAQLRHPNIISTHEVGRDGDTLYIVNDYVRGVPLSVLVADRLLGVRESTTLIAKIASALQHAHDAGVIHRDLKPSNVLIDAHGEPHLMDFGLAKRREREITVTTEGAIIGTPAYMSPQQARGEGHRVDGRSDIYSLGVILFQLLTGELPFRGTTQMLMHKVINDDAPGPRSLDSRVPKDLDTICLKCMNKEPHRRYATAGELADDLQRFLDGRAIVARRMGGLGKAVRWAKRNKTITGLLVVTMATLLAATLISTHFAWRAAQNAARADEQARALSDALYNSIDQEMRLTREVRRQGYGETIGRLIDRALQLDSGNVDKRELRRQMVLSLGDFVAFPPVSIDEFPGEVTSAKMNDDGSSLFVGLADGRVLHYETAGDLLAQELEGLDGPVQTIAVAEGGRLVVAADSTGLLHVWRHSDGHFELARTWQLEIERPLYAVTLATHGELLVTLDESVIAVWEVSSGIKQGEFATEPHWTLRNAAVDLTNRRLAAAYMDTSSDTVGWAIWNLDTRERLHHAQLPSLGQTYANAIAFGNEGRRLAIGFDEALLLYSTENFQQTNSYRLDSTKAVAFSATRDLATMDIRGRITLWNAVTNEQVAKLVHSRRRDSRDCLSFSADGTHLAAANAHSVRIWDLTRAKEKISLKGHDGGVPCAAFHPHGNMLATGGKDHFIHFWEPATGSMAASLELPEAIQALAYSPDGALLAVGTMGKQDAPHLRLIDAQSREILLEKNLEMGDVFALAWTTQAERTLLAASGRYGVSLWECSTEHSPDLDVVMELERDWCLSTTLDLQGQCMVWAEINQLHAWDIERGQERTLTAPPMLQGWHGMAFLPSEESLVYVSREGIAEVWDVGSDSRKTSFAASETFNAPHVAASPDGRWLAALTQSDAVSIWACMTGEHVYSLRPEGSAVWSLAWSPSANVLVVGRTDGSVAVWSLSRIEDKLAERNLAWRPEP